MGDTLFYQYIDRLSLFYNYFAFLDTDAYLADQLFIKHQVRVHFCEEYVRGDSPYRVIFCHVRKRDRSRGDRDEQFPDLSAAVYGRSCGGRGGS